MAQAPKKKTPGVTKRMAVSHAGIDPRKLHTLDEAVKLIKARASAKFDETVEIAMNLGVDPKYPDQQVRGVVSLPNGTGRTARVAVFAKGAKAEEAKAAVLEFKARGMDCWYNPALTGAEVEIIGVR